MAAMKTIFCLMQIFIAYTIFTSLSWIKSLVFTPMVIVGKLSSFQSSLVGKLIGYQEVQVHDIDSKKTKTDDRDEDGDNVGVKESKNGDIKEGKNETNKISLSDSGTVLDKNFCLLFENQNSYFKTAQSFQLEFYDFTRIFSNFWNSNCDNIRLVFTLATVEFS